MKDMLFCNHKGFCNLFPGKDKLKQTPVFMAALHQGFCWQSYADYTWHCKPSICLYTTITFKVVLLFLGKCTINPILNIKKQYPKKWKWGPTDNAGTETPACLQKNHTRDESKWRLKAVTSQLLLHRNDRSRKVKYPRENHGKTVHLLVCKYQWNICGSTYLRDFHNITTKERSFSKCIQASSLCSISYKMVPLSEWDIHRFKEWNLIQFVEYAELTVHAIRFYPRKSRGLKTTYRKLQEDTKGRRNLLDWGRRAKHP